MSTRGFQAHGRSLNRRRWPVGILLAAGLLLSTDALLPALAWPTSKPAISSFDGPPRVGQTLTAVPDDNDRYKWQRCNTTCGNDDPHGDSDWPDISGSEGTKLEGKDSYTLTSSDRGYKIRVVGKTTGQGENHEWQASTPVGPVEAALAAPQNTAVPTISGEAREGKTLTTTDGTWTGNPAPTFTYQWQRSGNNGPENITGATQNSYTLAAADVGHTVRVVVTGSNSVASSSATSAETASVKPKPPTNSTPPTVLGTAREGETLAGLGDTWNSPSAPISTSYQWQRSGNCQGGYCDIAGAAGSTYKLTADDIGHTMRVVATADNGGGNASAPSDPVGPVLAAPPSSPDPGPSIAGEAVEGGTLTADPGSWKSSQPITSFDYQWQRSGSPFADIPGATGESYTLTGDDVGHEVRVAVTASNSGGASQPYYSQSAGQVQSKPAPPQSQSEPQPQQQQPVATQSSQVAPPEAGESGNLDNAGGSVCARVPGSVDCVPINKLTSIPEGTIVDATNGFASLTTEKTPGGPLQSATFWAGAFRFSQTDGARPIVVLNLVNGIANTAVASRFSRASRSGEPVATAARVRSSRRLWGSGKGRYRTKGRYSSASVRGTHWLVLDRRDGTLTRVRRGVVVVRDFVKRLRVVLGAGGRYLARRR